MTTALKAVPNQMPDYMRKHGLKLLANGYNIVPIQPNSKACLVSGWQSIKVTEERVKQWVAENPSYGIGIRTDNLVVIDGDILHPEIAKEMCAFIERLIDGVAVKVTGLPPKTAYLCRQGWEGDIPSVGKIQRPYTDNEGKRQNIEILHGAKQKVAFGIHPDTGKPYEWSALSPLDVKLSDLPMINREQVDQIMAKFAELAEAEGWSEAENDPDAEYMRMSPEEWAFEKASMDKRINDPKEGVKIYFELKSAIEKLVAAPNDPLKVKLGTGGDEDWISIGYALKQASLSTEGSDLEVEGQHISEAIKELWLSTCHVRSEGERRWEDFKPERTHFPTVFRMATDLAEWVNPRSKPKLPTVTQFLSNARLSLADIQTPPEPPKYLIDGLFPENVVGILAAKGGTGKSMLSLQMAIAICTGTDFLGYTTPQPRKVLILTAEDSREIYRKRIHDLITSADMPEDTQQLIAENLLIKDLTDDCDDGTKHPSTFTSSGMDSRRAEPTELAKLVADAAAETGQSLVIVDTYSRTNGGEENSNEDAATFIKAIEQIKKKAGASVLLIAHTRKDAEGFGDDIAGGGRLSDTARFVMMLTPYLMTRGERSKTLKIMDQAQANRYLALSIQKDSYGAGLGKTTYLVRDSDSPVMRRGEQVKLSGASRGKEKMLDDIQLLCAALDVAKDGQAVTLADVKRWTKAEYGLSRDAALRAKSEAEKLGIITSTKQGNNTELKLVKNWRDRLEELNPMQGFEDITEAD